LVFAYGAMQSVVSQPIAAVIERYGFQPVCFLFGLMPLASYALVHLVIKDPANHESRKKISTSQAASVQ